MFKKQSGYPSDSQSFLNLVKYFFLMLGVTLVCILSSPTFANISQFNLPTPQAQIPNTFAPKTLVEQGKAFYETGQFTLATEVLKQAVAGFKAAGDLLSQSIALSNLSLTYQQLGKSAEAETAINQSLNLLQTSNLSKDRSLIWAQALDVQGKLQFIQGQPETALLTWQKAADIYQRIGDKPTFTRNRINSAQAMQALGLYRQAQKTLTAVQQTLVNFPDLSLQVRGLRELGNVLRVIGDLNTSKKVLEQSLALANQLKSSVFIGDTLVSLANTVVVQSKAQLNIGNTDLAQQQIQTALNLYQQAAAISPPLTRIQAQLNQLSLILEIPPTQRNELTLKEIFQLSSQILSQINNLLPSRNSAYARIQFASILMNLVQKTNTTILSNFDIAQLLSTAVQQAQNLKDQRAESYALGTLGHLYETNQQLTEALELTKKALFIAQALDASDMIYQWQWQQGRLFKQQGNIQAAVSAYYTAYKTLESLRGDLVTANLDVQFSFRDSVEPVYRDLVDLQLQLETLTNQQASNQSALKQARQVVESLQLAELNNFFRSPCLERIVEIDKVLEQDPKAAVIYPIILSDRLEIILTLPNQQLRHYTTKVSQQTLENTVEQLRKYLTDVAGTYEVKQHSQKIYEWLIHPLETELFKSHITTLVFVLDGQLRNIPIGVLYDLQQNKYLIEKYAISLTPGLQLFNPTPLQKVQLDVLTAGITEARFIEGQQFPPLKNVEQELKQIQAEILKNQLLFNQKFVDKNLIKDLQTMSFSVVHLATHGEFSSDPERTFILTWDKLLKVKQFDTLLRVSNNQKPNHNIELLVLSACKTALGDQRAALGLAGIAVRAGARSTVASLWSVDDLSTTKLMSEFYRQLKTPINKAQALQRAQLAIFAHEKSPYFWSPYVLVGNWL